MLYLPKVQLAFVTVLAIASFGWIQSSSQAIASLPPAPETGTPNGQRTPGGTRPELTRACKQTAQLLTALVPENGKGLTTAEYPSFWFYIPYAPKDISLMEFSLHNQEEKTTLYRTFLQLPETPGVIGIPLPPNSEHSLKLNQSYHWYFIVNCKPEESFGNEIVLDGWVTRVQRSPNLKSQFDIIWYDELTNLARIYLSEPQNIAVKNAWTKLLISVGLQGLAQAPLVNAVSYPKE